MIAEGDDPPFVAGRVGRRAPGDSRGPAALFFSGRVIPQELPGGGTPGGRDCGGIQDGFQIIAFKILIARSQR